MEPSSEITSELESFRERWKAEVKAKKEPVQPTQSQRGEAGPSAASSSAQSAVPTGLSRPIGSSSGKPLIHDHDDDGYEHSFDAPAEEGASLPGQPSAVLDKEPVTALEHYEQAVAKEDAGNLGDSLRLYRTAFKMDDAVDKKYKNKHFPTIAPPPHPKSTHTTTTATTSAQPSSQNIPQSQPQKSAYVQTPITDLIASFAHLNIAAAPPEIEGTPAPPCPIASLPEEILAHILRDVAVSDIGDFVRLALICRRFAYLVATEELVWRRICEGAEWGFSGMWRQWAPGVEWSPVSDQGGLKLLVAPDGEEKTAEAIPPSVLSGYSSWKSMFRLRPRVRFNGVYISTVNYIRTGSNAGVEAANQGPGGRSTRNFSWTNPVHIVTYYRYLRFFRDGTVLSLLTTTEPKEVVHHLTREEALAQRPEGAKHRARIAMAVGSTVAVDAGASAPFMRNVLRGRWRLGKGEAESSAEPGPVDAPMATEPGQQSQQARPGPSAGLVDEGEDNLYVETEGIGKYLYQLDLALRGGGARGGDGKGDARGNNSKKLVWRGFYSYNTLTDDWAEFGLKNDKPFFFSRVRSYGNGE